MLESQSLVISPQVKDQDIRPNGVRVRLNSTLIQYADQVVDPMKDQEIKYQEISLITQQYALLPGAFILGSTVELIKTPRDIVGLLDGRSTLARLGLMIHMTASVTDSLYEEPRSIVLEIYNASNMTIILSNNMPIGSLLFVKVDQPVHQKTQNQYHGQSGTFVANLKNQFS